MASLNILCSNLLNLSNKIAKIEQKKIFCGPSKILKNISWTIDIYLRYFMSPQKPPSYILNVRSLSKKNISEFFFPAGLFFRMLQTTKLASEKEVSGLRQNQKFQVSLHSCLGHLNLKRCAYINKIRPAKSLELESESFSPQAFSRSFNLKNPLRDKSLKRVCRKSQQYHQDVSAPFAFIEKILLFSYFLIINCNKSKT